MAKRTAMVSIRIVSDANTKGFKKAAEASNSLIKNFTKFTAISTSVASAAGIAGGAIGQVAVGAAALGAVAGPALATVALGMDGIKEAATAAQGPFDQLKADLSASFADQMTDSFSRLGDTLNFLNRPLADLGATVGSVFAGMLDTVSANGAQLEALTLGATDFVATLGPGLNTLVDGFLQIGTVIQDTGGLLGEAFGGVLSAIGEKFAELSNNGVMEQLVVGFAQALDGLGDLIGPLIDLLANLGVALGPNLGGVFSALGVAVDALVEPLTRITEVAGAALVDALNILAPALGPVGDAIAALTEAVAPLLAPLAEVVAVLGTALADAISAVAPLVGDIASLIGESLSLAIGALEPLLPALVDSIGILADSFRPLIPVLMKTAQDLFPVLQDVIAELSPLFPQLAGLVGELVQSLVPIIPPLAEVAKALFPALGDIIQALMPIVTTIVQIFTQLLDILIPILDPLAQLASDLFPAVADIVDALAPLIEWLAKVIGTVLGGALDFLVDLLSGVINWFDSLIDKIEIAIDWLRDFSDWVSSIPVPSFGDVFGANPWGGTAGEFYGAAAGGLTTTALATAPRASRSTAPVINITVNGALDPNAVAAQIKDILKHYERRNSW